MVTRRVAGQPAGEISGPYPDTGHDPVAKLATALAALHAIKVADLKLPGFSDYAFGDEALAATIGYWRRWYVERGEAPEPVLELALDWLRDNRADGISPVVIVHGDCGFHNMLIDPDTGEATLLDWELCHPGSAAEDIARAHEGLGRRGDFESFLDIYAACGGSRPTPRAMGYYEVFRLLRTCLIHRACIMDFNQGLQNDKRLTEICLSSYPKNCLALASMIEAAPAIAGDSASS
jgi:aminoglycoside phosphotransferase (APT) family kinase protein